MRALAEQGRVVLLVSHRLQELVRAADQIVTIKDGMVGAILAGDEVTERNVARKLADASRPTEREPDRRHAAEGAAAALSLEDWHHPAGAFSVPALTIGAGEIVAFVGVEGSGARELTRSVAGFEPTVAAARLAWQGEPLDPSRSCGFVPASRQESVFSTLSVGDCLVARMPAGRVATPAGLVRSGRAAAIARELIAEYGIRCSGPRQPVAELSGGNQQKVILASAVAADPRVLAVEEPTRGVDVGSRTEIYGFLRRFASSGHGVVLFCTELTEVLEAADRAVVMSRGRVVGEVRITPELTLGELAETVAVLESAQPGAAA
jgi:ABC-type sugar transport system ATPase subunit